MALSESLVFGLLLADILQSSIAIRSPPAPYWPVPSPAKALSPPRQLSKSANWRNLGNNQSAGLSPNVRPLPLPPPSIHHSSRRSACAGDPATPAALVRVHVRRSGRPEHRRRQHVNPRSLVQSCSFAFTNFVTSPSSPSPSSTSAPHDRSFGSVPPSPSPTSPLAAYRGRRAPTGRASFSFLASPCSFFFFRNSGALLYVGGLDGSLLARLTQGGSDSDAEE
jgi:hypothetical protein